jgi:hypothetical protein
VSFKKNLISLSFCCELLCGIVDSIKKLGIVCGVSGFMINYVVQMLGGVSTVSFPNSDLQSLLFFLASVSIGSWSLVVATTLIRTTVRLGYKILHKQAQVENLENVYEEG